MPTLAIGFTRLSGVGCRDLGNVAGVRAQRRHGLEIGVLEGVDGECQVLTGG